MQWNQLQVWSVGGGSGVRLIESGEDRIVI